MRHIFPPAVSFVFRWITVVLLMGLAAVAQFNRYTMPVAGTEVFIEQMHVDETRMSWVYFAFLITYTVGMLPGGWLIDRVGPAATLTLMACSLGLFAALTGAVGWTTGSSDQLWLGLLVVRGLAGMCSAPLHPGAARLVSDIIPPRGRATANGMVTAGAILGISGSSPVFGRMIDGLGWQWAFVAGGLTLVVFGIAWMGLSSVLVPRHGPRERAATVPVAQSWKLLGSRSLWLLALSYAAFGYFQYLFFYWMEHYFLQVLGLHKPEAREAVFWCTLAMAPGMALGGVLTDVLSALLGTSLGRRTVVMSGMALAAVFGLLALRETEATSVRNLLALSMLSLGMCEGVFWTTATDLGGPARGLSGAFLNTGGNIGGMISPVIGAYMSKGLGWPGAIAVACGISALGSLAWFGIRIPEHAVSEENDPRVEA